MTKLNDTNFGNARDYILGIPKFSGKNDIEVSKDFYKYLNSPGAGLKIIHVAGTNGKGSVCSYLNSILMEGGFSVGLFTSPHLVSICERIRLNNRIITEEDFALYTVRLKEKIEEYRKEMGTMYHPSFFEFLFYMSMLYYEDARPDYVILETGLGGRLDATNMVDNKVLTIITKLGFDHMEYLGETIKDIAYEKAGIMRRNVPVVSLREPDEAYEVITKYAEKLQAPLISVEKADISFSKNTYKGIDFSIFSRYYGNVSATLGTIAGYQTDNAALAVRGIEALKMTDKVTLNMLQRGLSKAVWEGRMEEIQKDVFLDGAHNEDGINAFLDTVRNDGFIGKRTLIFAVVRDKQYEKMVKLLAQSGLFDRICVSKAGGQRELKIDEIRGMFEQYTDCPVVYFESVKEAFTNTVEHRGNGNRVYIAGSLYLVGEIKELMCRME